MTIAISQVGLNQEFACNSCGTKDLQTVSAQSLDSTRPPESQKNSGALFPTCRHIKPDGVRCGSPALRGKSLCYFHNRPPRKPKPLPPSMPDPTNIPAVLTFTMRGLMNGKLEPAAASKIIYIVRNFMMKKPPQL
jgi:hypothetical protein